MVNEKLRLTSSDLVLILLCLVSVYDSGFCFLNSISSKSSPLPEDLTLSLDEIKSLVLKICPDYEFEKK